MFDEPVQFSDDEEGLDTPEVGKEENTGELLAVIPNIVQRKMVIWGTNVGL